MIKALINMMSDVCLVGRRYIILEPGIEPGNAHEQGGLLSKHGGSSTSFQYATLCVCLLALQLSCRPQRAVAFCKCPQVLGVQSALSKCTCSAWRRSRMRALQSKGSRGLQEVESAFPGRIQRN